LAFPVEEAERIARKRRRLLVLCRRATHDRGRDANDKMEDGPALLYAF
jgi:hypothetical protein